MIRHDYGYCQPLTCQHCAYETEREEREQAEYKAAHLASVERRVAAGYRPEVAKVLGYLGIGVTEATVPKIAAACDLPEDVVLDALGDLDNDDDAVTRRLPDVWVATSRGEDIAALLFPEGCPV
jgi:hypothetical protein